MNNGRWWIIGGILSWAVAFPAGTVSFGKFWDYKYAMVKVRDSFYEERKGQINHDNIGEIERTIGEIEDGFYYEKIKSAIGMGISASLLGTGYVFLRKWLDNGAHLQE